MFVKALDLRNFEINQLAQRNNFFMIFQGVLLAGVLQSDARIPVISFLACCAGLFVSLFQTGMAAGAKYWQDRWEYEVKRAERIMLREIAADPHRRLRVRMFPRDTLSINKRMVARLLHRNGRSVFNRLIILKPSVSRIPIYTGVVLSFIWLLLLLCTVESVGWLGVPSWIVGFDT